MDISVTSKIYVILANFYNTLLLMNRLIHEEEKNCLIFFNGDERLSKRNKPLKRF